MNLYPTTHFKRQLKQKAKKNFTLKNLIKNKLNLLLDDSRHPSLRLHKLKGKKIDQYSIWIESNLRIIFLKEKDSYILTDLINHDQY
jgi:mRNA-degrading endonuclease YafQ of YafQ-DinJ toxin-antitoxin module